MALQDPLIVGRSRELAFLNRLLNTSIKGAGKIVFISGEAGSGKTRVINEFLRSIQNKEFDVLYGWCLSNVSTPYFPFIEAFNSAYLGLWELVAPLKKQVGAQLDVSISPLTMSYGNEKSARAWMDSTFASFTKELLNLSAKRPLILILEDMHWADSASLSLLHYIARLISLERILVLASFRSEAAGYSSEGQASTLMQTIRAMARDDLFVELKLSGLSRVEISELAANMLGGTLQNRFLELLSTESQGNPLFIIESLRMLMNEGVLICKGGQWRPTTDRLRIPSKVKDIVMQRVYPLTLGQRRILDAASIVGDKFDAELVAGVLNKEPIEVLAQLDNIAHCTSLVKCIANYFSFDHATSREIIYDEMQAPLRIGYHLKIAKEMESLPKEKNIAASDLAYHYKKAGNNDKTIFYSILAGKDALLKFSNLEAKRYFSNILGTADPEGHANEYRIALEGLGDAFFNEGEFKKAQMQFEQLMKSTSDGLVKLRALRKVMAAARWLGDFSYAIELSQEAEPFVNIDKLEYARILLIKGAALGSWGKPRDALDTLEQSIEIFEGEFSLGDLAQALNESASLYQTQGYPEKAVSIAKRAIALNMEIGDLRGLVDAYFYAGQIFFNYKLNDEALNFFSKAAEIGQRIGYSNRISWAYLYSAIVLGILGKLDDAVSKNLMAVKYASQIDSIYTKSQSYANLLGLYSKLGELGKAEELFQEASDLFEKASKAGSKLGYSAIIKAQALFYAGKTEWKKSNELFNAGLKLLEGALFAEIFEAILRDDFAASLEKQGNILEAKEQRKKAVTLTTKIGTQFQRLAIESHLMVKKEKQTKIYVRVSLVNTSKKNGFLSQINNIFPSIFRILEMPVEHILANNFLNLKRQVILPFELVTIKFSLYGKQGKYEFCPEIVYEDENGNTYSSRTKPVDVVISEQNSPSQEKNQLENQFKEKELTQPIDFQFGTQTAKSIFEFLVNSLANDYMRLRLPIERSGWRTCMDVVKHCKVPLSSVYGKNGKLGRALVELNRRGLIEVRYFTGERGRGGKIRKLRVSYDKESIKRLIDLNVAQGKK